MRAAVLLFALLGLCVATAQRAVAAPLPPAAMGGPTPVPGCPPNTTVGFHPALCDGAGNLIPWTLAETVGARDGHAVALRDVAAGLQRAVDMEMAWYAAAPVASHGFPAFAYSTFVGGDYEPQFPKGLEIIPATQLGMGIVSYVKYWYLSNGTAATQLALAARMADYVVQFASTPAEADDVAWAWPNVTRSSGLNTNWPIVISAQSDVLFGFECIEPDKVAVAGWALWFLADALDAHTTGSGAQYRAYALHSAQVLAATMRAGNATHAPWPFRVNARTGAAVDPNGERNGNMAFALRLFRALSAAGHSAFDAPAAALWGWIAGYELTADNSSGGSSLFVNFFEDQTAADNRNSWSALELARLLIEQRADPLLGPDWAERVSALLAYALTYFGRTPDPALGGAVLMGEQDADHKAWGGASSKLGGVTALYACALAADASASASAVADAWAQTAANNLSFLSYFVAADGCPSDHAWEVNANPPPPRGGWQEDAHTDVVHNFVDAIRAFNGLC